MSEVIVDRQPITSKQTYRFGRGGMLGGGYVGPQWFSDLMVRITSFYSPLNVTYVYTDLPDGRYVVYALGNPNLFTRRRHTEDNDGDAQLTTKGFDSHGSSYKAEFGEILSARIGLDRKTLIVRRRPNPTPTE